MAFDKKYEMVSQEVMDEFSKRISDELRGYSAEGLEDEVGEFLDMVKVSMEKYVPIDTAATKNSWFQEVVSEKGKVTGIFGHDEEGQLDYVPFIYLGLHPKGGEIQFRDGKRALWLEPAVQENLGALKAVLSKSGGNQ